jgi:hypothetical protein
MGYEDEYDCRITSLKSAISALTVETPVYGSDEALQIACGTPGAFFPYLWLKLPGSGRSAILVPASG